METLATDIIGELKGRLVVAQSNIREIHTAIRKACALSYALADSIDRTAIDANETSSALLGICDILNTAESIAEKEDKDIGKYLDGGWNEEKNGTNKV